MYDPQLSSRLLCLPFEVLDRIYDAYLAFSLENFHDTLRPFHVYLDNGEFSTPLPPLMLTCKRVYNEMRPHVHVEAALKAYMMEFGPRLGFAVHGILRYARLERLYLIVAMEHAYWNRWMPFFTEVAARSQALKELVIDWHPRLAQTRAVQWEVRANAAKEKQLFDIIGGLKELQVVRLYGDAPAHWREQLKSVTDARLVVVNDRWWRDPGRLW
ncbi:hypothetical protein GQ53DRAFT_742217 [Thozetella sp. PMI_491]|nr:hypothetical protein GQ53DRAFT_742217 [Thozetella sp. PMI_491]